ncbi:MAG: mandelate racemase/muconate lactonizing enzyme family protein [Planctomycetes bacterium]|nr:mandelate racemase/muconate lactonizing enzyme family protein [Planctomycetota bacterium]
MAKIAQVEVLPIAVPVDSSWDCDGSVDTLVVRVTDEDGVAGIGECDAPPGVVKAFIEMPSAHIWSQNLVRQLVGADPFEIKAIWERLYETTQYPGRRGLGIHALSAIDIALHDLAGKQVGRPVYKLLGGARREFLLPYATIFPGMPAGRSIRELMEIIHQLFQKALQIGFRAVKMEVLFYELVTDRELVDLIREGRRMVGPDVTLMVDFGYRWRDWHAAKWVIDRIADCDIYFAEAAVQHDDLHGHARLADHTDVRICGAEHAATRWEIREWIEKGKVAVVQPDINRCGGLTEIRRIAEMAELYGVQVIPHGWKTGITAACGRHFHASTLNAEFFEFLSPDLYDSPLRRDLVSPEPEIREGRMELPAFPGLGVSLNPEAVEKYSRPIPLAGRATR